MQTLREFAGRLRRPRPDEIVHVSLSGANPAAVTAIARALATVAAVSGMSHRPAEDGQAVTVEVTCHPHTPVRPPATGLAVR
jgi:hypothetical protein